MRTEHTDPVFVLAPLVGQWLNYARVRRGELDSWSLFPWEARVVTCGATAVLTTEARRE
jgi:hypothetical protein